MKNIVLTGSSSGFGLVTAMELAQRGFSVYATMRNTQTTNAAVATKLSEWAESKSLHVYIVELDVTNEYSVKEAVSEIAIHTGNKIDVLINNAGAGYIGLNETLSAEQTNQLFQINVIGADRMIKAVLPCMHKRKDGLLITVSSVAARFPIPMMGAYGATKAAIDALSFSYYHELQSSGINVAIVQPGAFPSTDIISKQIMPAHPEFEKFYRDELKVLQEKIIKSFEYHPGSPDPVEVAKKIIALIDAPKGSQPIWSIIEGGPHASEVAQANELIKHRTESLLQASGILHQ
jgi:NAD(P)-dependent dehydrogenase (short-subunit alcohol dehydrogenase family)